MLDASHLKGAAQQKLNDGNGGTNNMERACLAKTGRARLDLDASRRQFTGAER
jgi:hypothetical protein